jgi:hypothetical protein
MAKYYVVYWSSEICDVITDIRPINVTSSLHLDPLNFTIDCDGLLFTLQLKPLHQGRGDGWRCNSQQLLRCDRTHEIDLIIVANPSFEINSLRHQRQGRKTALTSYPLHALMSTVLSLLDENYATLHDDNVGRHDNPL